MSNFIIKLCCCCFNTRKKQKRKSVLPNVEQSDDNIELQEKSFITASEMLLTSSKLQLSTSFSTVPFITKASSCSQLNYTPYENLFPLTYYRQDETLLKQYTKEKLLELINSYINDKENYYEYFNTNDISISINTNGTIVNCNIPCVRVIAKLKKKISVTNNNNAVNNKTKTPQCDYTLTLENMFNLINNPYERMKWDKELKTFKIVKYISENKKLYLRHCVFNKFDFNINQRDVIEKKIDIYSKRDYYSFSSSIKDGVYQKMKNVERMKNLFNVTKLTEKGGYIYVIKLLQVDYKLNNNSEFIFKKLPHKINEWFVYLHHAVENECINE